MTAYAKLDDLPLRGHFLTALSYLSGSAPQWALGLAAGWGVLLLARVRETHWLPLWLLALSLPLVGVLVKAGGDHMPGARFLLPLVVLAGLGAGVAGGRLVGRSRVLALLFVGVAAAWQIFGALVSAPDRDPAASVGAIVGRFLGETLPPRSLVAVATAGSTPYFAPKLDFIDTLGLNDKTIAKRRVTRIVGLHQALPGHRKGDGAYVLARAPDVVILGGDEGTLGEEPHKWFLTDYELLASPEFRARYRPFAIEIAVRDGEVRSERVRAMLRGGKTIEFIAWLRRGSAPAERLARLGRELRPPPPFQATLTQ